MSNEIIYQEKDYIEMAINFKNGESIRAIAQNFGCSYATMRRFLEKNIENYKEIAKENLEEAHRKSGRKLGKLPATEKQKEACRKTGKMPKTESQLNASRENTEKMNESNLENNYEAQRKGIQKTNELNAKNGNWISRPEAIFYITCLSKNFFLKDIKPQYYIKEIKHRVDFAIPSQKLLFEVDGDHFHGHSGDPDMDRERLERDAQIDKWAKDTGWTIFRYNDEKMRKFGIIK